MGNAFDIIEQRLRDSHSEYVASVTAIAKNLGEDPTERIAQHAAKTEKRIEDERLKFNMYHGQ